MKTILLIIGGAAVLFGIVQFIFSNKGDPKERAVDAAGAAAGGAMITIGCLMQLIIPAITVLIGFWLLGKIFG